MSKMAMPAMEVVRFREKDVIVASQPFVEDGLILRLFNNGTTDDATIEQMSVGIPYKVTDFVNILRMTKGDENVWFQYQTNPKVIAKELLPNEENNTLMNGLYSQDADDATLWVWRHQ